MALFEASALGARFAITRWIASVLGVAAMAVIIDRAVTKDERRAIYTRHEVLPSRSVCPPAPSPVTTAIGFARAAGGFARAVDLADRPATA